MATYYVSEADGSNTYDGLASTYQSGTNGPWRWISYAFTQASAGDLIEVRTGSYTDIVAPTDNVGTSGSKITIQAYGHVDSSIRGVSTAAEVVTMLPFTSSSAVISLHNLQIPTYFVFKSIIFDGTGGGSTTSRCVEMSGSDNNEFRNCEFTSSYDTGVNIEGDNNLVRYCASHDCGGGNITGHGFYIRGDTNIIEYNDIYDNNATNNRAGVQIRQGSGDATGNIVRYNAIYGNGSGIFLHSNCPSSVIHHNRIYNNANRGIDCSSQNGSIGTVIYNNVIVDHDYEGIKVWTADTILTKYDITATNNILYDNGQIGGDQITVQAGQTLTQLTNSTTDPSFNGYVQGSAWDFTLTAGSSAVLNIGTTLTIPYSVDYAGVIHGQGSGWEIGAYEYPEDPDYPVNVLPTETLRADEQTILTNMTVIDNNTPAQLLNEVRLRTTSTATFTKADISGGASLCA